MEGKYFMKNIFKFLRRLKKNNNRDWFKSNKSDYDNARDEFIEIVDSMIAKISKFDPAIEGTFAKDSLFRIYRDIRFSKDKTPYKVAFGASINPGGRKLGVPGYYLHIQPGECFLAGGDYMPESKRLLKIRKAIVKNTDEFFAIPKSKTFQKYFDEISTKEKLKTFPRGFAKDHKAIEYLKYKGYYVHHKVKDKDVQEKGFTTYSTRVFKAMYPLNTFLRDV